MLQQYYSMVQQERQVANLHAVARKVNYYDVMGRQSNSKFWWQC